MVLLQKWFYTQIVNFTLWRFQILQKNSLFSSGIAGAGSETVVVVQRGLRFQGVDKGLTHQIYYTLLLLRVLQNLQSAKTNQSDTKMNFQTAPLVADWVILSLKKQKI